MKRKSPIGTLFFKRVAPKQKYWVQLLETRKINAPAQHEIVHTSILTGLGHMATKWGVYGCMVRIDFSKLIDFDL